MTFRHSGAGSALVIVLLILTALLLLGVPFLASQSTGRAGARQVAESAMARLARLQAEGEAVAAVLPTTGATSTDYGTVPELEALSRNRFRLRSGSATMGAVIEDESGKLDVHGMGPAAWSRLLAQVGIQDMTEWDWQRIGGTDQGEWQPGPRMQLADTLAKFPSTDNGAGYPIRSLDDLLKANPASHGYLTYPTHSSVTWRPTPAQIAHARLHRVRPPLTLAELDLLRPFITCRTRSQTRYGLVDAGTIIHAFPPPFPLPIWVINRDAPMPIGSGDLLSVGVVGPVPNSVWAGTFTSALTLNLDRRYGRDGDPLGLRVPASGNPNHAEAVVQAVHPGRPASAPSLAALEPGPWTSAGPHIDPVDGIRPTGEYSASSQALPPSTPRSSGVITVETAGVGTDQGGRPTGRDARRTIVQVVDQERGAREWADTQGEWQELVNHRLMSQMMSGTAAYDRVVEVRASPGAHGWDDPAGSVETMPLPFSMPENSPPDAWIVETGSPRVSGIPRPVPASAIGDAQGADPDPASGGITVTNQGLDLSGALVYALAIPQAGPLRRNGGGSIDGTSVDGRWISLWVRIPDPGRSAVIWSARATPDSGTLRPGIDGTAGDNRSQHRFELRFDPDVGGLPMLRLVSANGAVPHTASATTAFGPGDWQTDDLATGWLDERSLGAAGLGGLVFADAPAPAVDDGRVAELRMRFTPKPERWYRIDAVWANDQPGGWTLLVDGIVGRQWPTGAGDFLQRDGDAYPWPTARTTGPIPPIPATPAGPGDLLVDDVLLELPAAGLTVDSWLPRTAGIVRVNEEYLAYAERDGLLLRGVRRGIRVNTQVGTAGRTWPRSQSHASGSLVVPGWYRVDTNGETLYDGQARLAQQVGRGDDQAGPTAPPAGWNCDAVVDGTYPPTTVLGAGVGAATTTGRYRLHTRFRTWAWISPQGFPVPAPNADERSYDPGSDLLLVDRRGDWPDEGQAVIHAIPSNERVATIWFRRSGDALEIVSSSPTSTLFDNRDALLAVVTSIRAEAMAGGFPGAGAFQIAHPDTRAIEWILYDRIATMPGGAPAADAPRFFLNRDGFPFLPDATDTARGAMRTAFPGLEAALASTPWGPGVPMAAYPPGSGILPVQGLRDRIYGLESGDVVTLAEREVWTEDTPPIQMVIRHAAADSWVAPSATPAAVDTKNSWFTFTTPFPSATAPRATSSREAMILVGQGWTPPAMMTPAQGSGFVHTVDRTGMLPRIEAFGTAFLTDLQLSFGPDIRRLAADDPALGNRILIDGIRSADLAGLNDGFRTDGFGFLDRVGDRLDRGRPIATRGLASPSGRRRAWLVGGEVLISDVNGRATGDQFTQLGRGMLGSVPVAHVPRTVLEGGLVAATVPIPALPLPVGPIELLDQGEIPDAVGRPRMIELAGSASAPWTAPTTWVPAWLAVHGSDGSRSLEALQWVRVTAVNPRHTNRSNQFREEFWMVPWVRGMYGTASRTWRSSPDDPVILIGWWPRYPSALPEQLPGEAETANAMLRSRWYPWAAIAIHRYGMRLANAGGVIRGPDGEAMARLLAGDAAPLDPSVVGLEVAALPVEAGSDPRTWFDWLPLQAGGRALRAPLAGGTVPWDDPAWTGDIDGMEWRIVPRYLPRTPGPTPWHDLADAGASAFRIGRVEARAAAPVMTLSTEPSR